MNPTEQSVDHVSLTEIADISFDCRFAMDFRRVSSTITLVVGGQIKVVNLRGKF